MKFRALSHWWAAVRHSAAQRRVHECPNWKDAAKGPLEQRFCLRPHIFPARTLTFDSVSLKASSRRHWVQEAFCGQALHARHCAEQAGNQQVWGQEVGTLAAWPSGRQSTVPEDSPGTRDTQKRGCAQGDSGIPQSFSEGQLVEST